MNPIVLPDSAVWAKLPRAGLGNKLYVWARAMAFAHANQIPIFTSSWTTIAARLILRGASHWRLYLGAFRRQPLIARLQLQVLRLSHAVIHNPPVGTLRTEIGARRLYVFDGMGGGDPKEPFKELVAYRDLIIDQFQRSLTERTRSHAATLGAPIVGIHVRRGDFTGTAWMTPIEYFCSRLDAVRAVAKAELPATVFSDGTDEQLLALLAMPNVKRASPQSEILDFLQLSKSRVMILSPGSTFGMLAGFLGEGILIRAPEWDYGDSRPPNVGSRTYEGAPVKELDNWPPLLIRNLRELGSQGPVRTSPLNGRSMSPR